MMINRRVYDSIEQLLSEQAAVAILGPRQVGKTTLARQIADSRPSIYFDLEDPQDLAALHDPGSLLSGYADRLVVLDEIQRLPGLFESLRGLIDRYRRDQRGKGRFLLLGSASVELLRQTSESLAGRIAYRELAPLSLLEVPDSDPGTVDALWVRGGFPESWLAGSDRASMTWRRDFIRTYLERDIPQFDSRVPSETLRRFWTMLAHSQAGLLNASRLATSLMIDARTLNRYLDLLVDLLLVRRLQPWSGNVRKRLIRAPKIYLRDSGIVHALLALGTREAVLSHPVAGASWEGFVIENLLGAAPEWIQPSFYRTSAGAEIDLIIEFTPTRRWAIEIKRSAADPSPAKGFHFACEDLQPERRLVVYPGRRAFSQPGGVEVLPVVDMMRELSAIE